MPFELTIALRYLFAQRRQLFISVISTISTLGVVVGVMILLIALAIMTGFQGELRSRILGAASHLSIYKGGGEAFGDYRAVIAKLGGIDAVVGAAPVLYGKALVSSATGSALVTLKGIEPELEATVTEFGEKMMVGDLMRLSEPETVSGEELGNELPPVIVGEELAMTLGVFIGDILKVTSPEGHLSPFGMLPRTRSFRVAGIFQLGLYNFDNSWALLHLPDAQRLLGVGDEAMYVESKVTDLFEVERVEIDVMKAIGGDYGSMNWKETNRSLFFRILAREGGDDDLHQLYRGGGSAQYCREPDHDCHEQDAGHRDPAIDGGECQEHHAHLHVARSHHRCGGDGCWSGAGCSGLLGARPLSLDLDSRGRLSGGLGAVQAAPIGFHPGGHRGSSDLFRGDTLPGAKGCQIGDYGSVEIRMIFSVKCS